MGIPRPPLFKNAHKGHENSSNDYSDLPKLITCPNCGSPLNNAEQQEIRTFSPFAIASACAGIIAMFTPVIFSNIVVITSLILGIFSFVKKEKLKLLAIIGILLSAIVFFNANKQMDEARSKLNDAQQELERMQRQFR